MKSQVLHTVWCNSVNVTTEMFISTASSVPAVALAFEEMCTPHARGLQICVQRFGNAYQRKEIEKRMTHFKAPFHWVPLFAFAVRIASMILRTARFLCAIYAEICVNAARVPLRTSMNCEQTYQPCVPPSDYVVSSQEQLAPHTWWFSFCLCTASRSPPTGRCAASSLSARAIHSSISWRSSSSWRHSVAPSSTRSRTSSARRPSDCHLSFMSSSLDWTAVSTSPGSISAITRWPFSFRDANISWWVWMSSSRCWRITRVSWVSNAHWKRMRVTWVHRTCAV